MGTMYLVHFNSIVYSIHVCAAARFSVGIDLDEYSRFYNPLTYNGFFCFQRKIYRQTAATSTPTILYIVIPIPCPWDQDLASNVGLSQLTLPIICSVVNCPRTEEAIVGQCIPLDILTPET